jgi:hypothetical protein
MKVSVAAIVAMIGLRGKPRDARVDTDMPDKNGLGGYFPG